MDEHRNTETAEPRFYVWLRPGRLAVAERPGRGGRSHRKALREREIAWWREHGVTAVVSGMRSRHGLVEYGLADLRVRWCPITDVEHGSAQVAGLVRETVTLLDENRGAVLVHCDRANEWLAAVMAALRVELGLSTDVAAGLRAAEDDGLPIGSVAAALVGADRAATP